MQIYTVVHKNVPLLFFNSYVQHGSILRIFSKQHQEEILCK